VIIDAPRVEPPTVRFASIGDRLFAQLVDGAVAFGVFFFLYFTIASRFGDATLLDVNFATIPTVIAIMVAILIILFYFVAAEAVVGATLGKLAAEARVQSSSTGRLIGYDASLTRNGMRLIDGIGFYLVGGISMMLTPRRQRLGDLLARTVVVHRPTHGMLRATSLLVALGIAVGGVLGGWALRPSAELIGPARIASAMITDDPAGTASRTSFPADTQKIYLIFMLADALPNTVVKASWFAGGTPDARGGTPWFETEVRAGGLQTSGSFAVETPPNGWVVGDYRVELYANGTVARTERFRIEAPGTRGSPAAQGSPPPSGAPPPSPTR